MAYNGMCESFFLDLMTAEHDLDTDMLMLALYEDRNVMHAGLQEYTPVGECIGVNYQAGGIEIFTVPGYPKAEDGYAATCRFEELTFVNISASIGAALIYNAKNNRAIRCIDFGGNQLVVTSDFHIKFPADAEPPVFIKLLR